MDPRKGRPAGGTPEAGQSDAACVARDIAAGKRDAVTGELKKPSTVVKSVYPQIGQQDHRAEWEAWRAMAKIIGEKDATNHISGCQCEGFACRMFNAVRAWGAELVTFEEGKRKGLV